MEKPIEEWVHIFLDTCIIIDLFVPMDRINQYPEALKERIIKTKKLFEFFKASGTSRTFYISAITVGELTKMASDVPNDEMLIELFSSGDVAFVDYTKDIALSINGKLNKYLPDTTINQYVKQKEKELNEQNVFQARQYIVDDLKIIASANYLPKIDVILTSDKNTFLPIAEKFELMAVRPETLSEDLFGEIETRNGYS